MDIFKFWKAVLEQNEQKIRKYFHKDAYINWHCTNEHFTVDDFIIANCEYPGDWVGEIERLEKIKDGFITITCVYPKDKTSSFHVTSFIKIANDKIVSVDEYWAEDGEPPDSQHIRRAASVPILLYIFCFVCSCKADSLLCRSTIF